ncbi:MAG: dTMP kinase [Verrucomicrobia bacterium]|nr:dTMP kinase [Verrucomicrobiota bacterium]
MKLSSGLFITFEGGEGAGKTTLIEEIYWKLKGTDLDVVKTREPGGTKVGEEIRKVLLANSNPPISPYTELCLFLASRTQHIVEVIIPALEQKKIVLCDRFNDSTIAYQGAARGLGMKKVAEFCSFISQKLEPHLTLYLDIDPKIGLKRIKRSRGEKDRIEAETMTFHSKIREAFLTLHQKHPGRFQLLDASQPPANVLADAMVHVQKLLDKHYTYV